MAGNPRRIYILGAGTMQLPAIRIAHEFGWEVVCADGNADAVGRSRVDYFEHIDLKDRDGIAASVCRWRKERGLDGVFTAGTDFSAAVAYAAEQAGLPGIPYAAACRASDKALMRAAFAEAEIPSARFRVVKGTEEGLSLLSEVGLPAVVKPVDNMGARGIRRVDTEEEFSLALREALDYSRSATAIVEEYLEGPEFSLDGLIYHGEFSLCGIADRHIRYAPYFIEVGHTMPSAFDPEEQQKVIEVFRRGAAALGIDNGAAKGDIKLTPRGAVVGEIAARLSGGYMSGWTYPLSSGVEVTAGALKIAVGEAPGELQPTKRRVSAERAFYSIPGVLGRIDGFSSDGADAAFLTVAPGDRVSFPRNNVEKCGNFIYAADSREAAAHAAESACRRVSLFLEPGRKATLDFIRGVSFAWVPDAFDRSDSALAEFLSSLAAEPDIPDIRKEGFRYSAPEGLEAIELLDWHGRRLKESLDLLHREFPSLQPDRDGNLGLPFWNALLRGGYQGGCWYLATLRAYLEIGNFGEMVLG